MLRDRAAAGAPRGRPGTAARSAVGRDDVIEVGDRRARRPATWRSAPRASCRHEVGVLPLRDTVTFPDMLIPLNVGQARSVELINDVLGATG